MHSFCAASRLRCISTSLHPMAPSLGFDYSERLAARRRSGLRAGTRLGCASEGTDPDLGIPRYGFSEGLLGMRGHTLLRHDLGLGLESMRTLAYVLYSVPGEGSAESCKLA